MQHDDAGSAADTLARLVAPGDDFHVAGPDGVAARVRVKVIAGPTAVGTAIAGRIERGATVVGRVGAAERPYVLAFHVADVEETLRGRVDLELGVARIVPVEGAASPRARCDCEGSAERSDDAEAGLRLRPTPLRVVGAGPTTLELICDRKGQPGELLDIAFADGVGGRVRCRVAVREVEPVLGSRRRHGCEILAINDADARRLAQLVSRQAIAPTAGEPAPAQGGGWSWLRRRAS